MGVSAPMSLARGSLRRLGCCAGIGVALTLPVAQAQAAQPQASPSQAAFGISDMRPSSFTSNAFNAIRSNLHVADARFIVAYDVLEPGAKARYHCSTDPNCQPLNLQNWVAAVTSAHLRPFITIGPAACKQGYCPAPPVRGPNSFTAGFKQIVKAYPSVTEWASWNEPDLTVFHPEQAADYWLATERVDRQLHRHDTIVAGEFASIRPRSVAPGGYFARYRREIQRHGGHPKVWSLHAYADVNGRQSSETRRFLAATPKRSSVWLSEQGVVLSSSGALKSGDVSGQAAAARQFLKLSTISPKIKRVYYYQLEAGNKKWDSGVVTPTGKARASYCVLTGQALSKCLGTSVD